MENNTQPIESMSGLVAVLLDKLKADQTDITLDFKDLSLQGPGPQGQPGHWRINGQLSLVSKNKGNQK